MLNHLVTVALASSLLTPSISAVLAAPARDIRGAFSAALTRSGKVSGIPLRCIGFEEEEETEKHYDVRAHEVHGRGCAGDPETSPTLAFLRYIKKFKIVLVQDDDGNYVRPR